LIFPGNLQEIMNRVLAAERTSQAQLVDARTKAQVEEIQAKTRAEAKRLDAEAEAVARRLQLEAEAEAARLKAENETRALVDRQKAAEALERHPGLLRMSELEALKALAGNVNARVYLRMAPGVLKLGKDDVQPG
jgi:regulator of protease activity HflC (stomatin/prohibitin superfamily)